MEAVNDLCHRNSDLSASIGLSASSVVWRTEELGATTESKEFLVVFSGSG